MTPEIFELEGKKFIPAEQLLLPEWPCVLTERPQPTLTLKDNDLFLITDTVGNISGCLEDDQNTGMGLFCRDTRFLSRLELQIEGRSPVLLSSTAKKGFALSVLCANPHIEDRIAAENISIQRDIALNGGLFEEVTVTNYSTRPVQFELSLSFNADFVDLFEIRGAQRPQRGRLLHLLSAIDQADLSQDSPLMAVVAASKAIAPISSPADADWPNAYPPAPCEITLAYQGLDGALLESYIQFCHHQPDRLTGYTAVWQMKLASHETVRLGYRLQMLMNKRSISVVSTPMTLKQAQAAEQMEEQDWVQQITRIRSDNRRFNQVIERAEQDIYLLQQTFAKGKTLSAGVPWFSTLFGRDSLIAASQTLLLNPAIACDTLTILAHYQGKEVDEWRDEEPGKILHELRLGEMARCDEIPHTPYYGTVDATPLWIMLYVEYYYWTHDQATLDRLWPNALAAMDWIDQKCQATGYLTYERKSKRGLANQGWKDSGDCMVDRQGRLAEGAIALSEVQAYVYAAKVRLSEIARLKQQPALAERWQDDARSLKSRFNRDFWLEDEAYCALALDGAGRPLDSITSNPGHCLHLGILTPDKAQSVAERLQATDMFNGWGIRTLSSLSPAYNPMGYHIGAVWPHDNSLILLGLRSIGQSAHALEVAQGLIDMTLHQPYQRPPELFCGYDRTDGSGPVQYPVACSPQAWATGSIFQLLQMMVNLVPDAAANSLRIIDPMLPDSIHQLSIHNLRIGATLVDLEFERADTTTACRVTKKRGNLRVVIEA